MATVAELLREKGHVRPVSVPPAASVLEATTLMNSHGIGSLLVVDGPRLVGIFTERDVLRRVVAACLSPELTRVAEVMTADLVCCTTDASAEEIADVMRRRRIRHIPVIDANEDVIGLISIGDINAYHASSCEAELHQVHDYIFNRA